LKEDDDDDDDDKQTWLYLVCKTEDIRYPDTLLTMDLSKEHGVLDGYDPEAETSHSLA
jgi:hypothetical protein